MGTRNVQIDDPRPWLMFVAVVLAIAFATLQDIKSLTATRPHSIRGDIARNSDQGHSRTTAYGDHSRYQ